MANYTVFAIDPSMLGDGYTAEDIERLNDLIAGEIEASGLSSQYHAVVTGDDRGYSAWGSGLSHTDGELRAAVDRAFDRFNA